MTQETTTISAKVTLEQKEQLDRNAAECGMTRNQYIIARLFVDKDDAKSLKAKNLRGFDRDLMSALLKSHNLIQLMARKSIDEDEIKYEIQAANDLLARKGYKS